MVLVYCKCGCGISFEEKDYKERTRSYIVGHNNVGKRLSKERCDALKLINKGKIVSQEVRKKQSETRKKLFQEGYKHPLLGKHHTTKTKLKISQNKERGLKISQKLKGRIFTDEWRKKISKSKEGEKNSQWQGGKSFEPYTFDWTKDFRETVIQRDGCCMLCNMSVEDLYLSKRRVHIHHIDYNKLNSFIQNCITLCNPCHCKTNFNRTQWKMFFQSLLKERYCYEYSQDQKIILDFDGWNDV